MSPKQKSKFEGYKQALAYFWLCCFFTKSTLKCADTTTLKYSLTTKKYLGFAWKFNGKIRYFTFNVSPFGPSTAPYIFSKLLRPLVKLWRSRGFHLVVYLDDGINGLNIKDSLGQTHTVSHQTSGDLYAAGFVCGGIPSTVVLYDTFFFKINIPLCRSHRIKKCQITNLDPSYKFTQYYMGQAKTELFIRYYIFQRHFNDATRVIQDTLFQFIQRWFGVISQQCYLR